MITQLADWLYISNYRASIHLPTLQQHHIAALLHLAERVEHPNVTACYLPVEDGEPIAPSHLDAAQTFIATHYADKHPLLIACGAGMSRSVTFCMLALKEHGGMNLVKALQHIKARHPIAQPHPELLRSLTAYYHCEADYLQLIAM